MKKMMLYAKEDTVVPSNEEQVDTALLIIDEDGTVTGVTDKTKLNGTLALPAEVKKIGNNAFAGCTGLTNIGFSACTGLTQICEGAFRSCTGLTKIRFPASLTEIKYLAFYGCRGLSEVYLSACTTLTELGGLAFANISPTARFIVATETVKQLLKNSGSGIKDEQITVKK